MTKDYYLQKAIGLITQGGMQSSDSYAFLTFDEPTPKQKQLCTTLLRGGWRDCDRSLLARDTPTTGEIEIDGGVYALYQLLGEPLLAQLTALSRLTPNQ